MLIFKPVKLFLAFVPILRAGKPLYLTLLLSSPAHAKKVQLYRFSKYAGSAKWDEPNTDPTPRVARGFEGAFDMKFV